MDVRQAPPAAASAEEPVVESPPSPTEVPAPPAVDETPPGDIALLTVSNHKGWIAIGPDGISPVPTAVNGAMPQNIRTHQGRAFGTTYDQIVELRPSGIEPAPDVPKYDVSIVSDFTIAADGSLWLLHREGVSHTDGDAWTAIPFEGDNGGFFNGLAVDADGRPWIGTAKAIYRHVGDAWQEVEFPANKSWFSARGLSNSPTGKVYLPVSTALYELSDGGRRIKTKSPGNGSFERPRFSSTMDGTLYGIVEASSGAATFLPDDKPRFVKTTRKSGMDVGLVTAAAVDGRGRIWIGGDGGFAVDVPGPDGARTLETFPSGSVPELAGKVGAIIVLGQGPALPKAGEIATGGLSGAVTRDGAPLADATIEICPRPSPIFSRTPCTDEKPNFKSKTNGEGRFEFSEVPLGTYGLAVRTGRGKWQVSMFPTMGGNMRAGETFDVGTVAANPS